MSLINLYNTACYYCKFCISIDYDGSVNCAKKYKVSLKIFCRDFEKDTERNLKRDYLYSEMR